MDGSVAVVIPCFNDGGTLREAIASAQGQDLDVEVLVVDDGSTEPETIALLDRVEKAGLQVIRQRNQGPSAARMTGIRATTAEYVFALDADDLIAAGALPRLREVLDRRPEAAASWGAVRCFGEVEYVHRSRPSLDPWQVSYQNHLPVGSLYRRAALLEAGGWDVAGGYEDWDLWMSLAERGWQGVGIPEVTAHYRIQGGRRLASSSGRHPERYALLRSRHPALFRARRRNWRCSRAPLLLKLALPAIEALPLNPHHKRVLGGAATHIAYRSGWRTLAARYRAYRVLRRA
jgi:glycosyltransferase involved in cell wall biosynthesis